MNFPDKHPDMLVYQLNPYNAEPPLHLLGHDVVTPTELFYVRNHGTIPEIEPESFRLKISGAVKRTLELSLDDLDRYPTATLTATLQCAGNRRDELMGVQDIPGEVPWEAQTIGNAVWSGVRLGDVLDDAGLESHAEHVAFTGLDEIDKGGQVIHFGGSISMGKALSPEVLIARRMNGEALPREHGYPLRVVVPGYIGARSVKWLSHIVVQNRPSINHYQARSYKLFPPHIDGQTVDWERGLTLGELSVNAVICEPRSGETLASTPLRVSGYAIAGGNRTIERVDVSHDGGRRWVETTLLGETDTRDPWVWQLWETELELAPGPHELIVRAWDSAANTQPESVSSLWNFKGYMNNAWHRMRVTVQDGQ